MMPLVPRKLVTVVAPESAEESLTQAISALGLGVSGVPTHGKGRHGVRPDPWHGANVELHVVTTEAGLTPLFDMLEKQFLPATNLFAWVSDVSVWAGSTKVPE